MHAAEAAHEPVEIGETRLGPHGDIGPAQVAAILRTR
jgi:hypothetical protein